MTTIKDYETANNEISATNENQVQHGGVAIDPNNPTANNTQYGVSKPTIQQQYTAEANKAEKDAQNSFDLAKQQEYVALLDKEIALENSKQNALKYAQNTINANGFGGTGYGSSIQTGINNTYMAGVNDAKAQYNEAIDQIDVAEKEQIATDISSATSVDTLNQYMVDKGYGKVDENGNFVWGEKPEGVSEDDWTKLKLDYNNQFNNLGGSTDTYTGATYTNEDDFRKISFTTDEGKKLNLNKNFGKETSGLFNAVANGKVKYGGVVKVTNNNGQSYYAEYTKSGMRIVDADAFKKAKDSEKAYELTGKVSGWFDEFYDETFKKA